MRPLTAMTPLGVRVRVPLRLDAITTINPEVPAESVGATAKAVERIWSAAEGMFRTGLHPGMSLVVRRRGEVVLDRAIGHRLLGGDELMTTDTPACLFSGSKAISAVVIHCLVQDGLFGLDDYVADYIPEFGANGKGEVTVRSILNHRAGLARIPFRKPDPMKFFDTQAVLEALYAAPLSDANKQAYHAITGGYILGELAERTSGKDMRTLLREYLTDPLGIPNVTYGVPPERRDQVALSYSTGPKRMPPLTTMMTKLLGVPGHLVAPASNTPEAMDSAVLSAGICASARDANRIFQMLAEGGSTGGVTVLKPETLADELKPGGKLVLDAVLPAPIRFSAGFLLGERVASLYGARTPHAFGHLGFTNILLWADPSRALSVAFINTGKAISPEGFVGLAAVSSAISAAFRADGD